MRAAADFDAFAGMYDRHWSRFTEEALAVLERRLLPALPVGERVLDLCCGTGWLAAALAGRGYRLLGIDLSAAMLRFARENAPGVPFVQADARAFAVVEPVDAVVCIYDSLNHILELPGVVLALIGFTDVRAYDWVTDDPPPEVSERICFVCRKPGKRSD